MVNIPDSVLNNPVQPQNASDRATRVVAIVVRRTGCGHCGHELCPDEAVVVHGPCRDSVGRHRRPSRLWQSLAEQMLSRTSMTARLALLLLMETVPAVAVAVVLAFAGQTGLM
jgi:hypothetical protein